MNQYLLKEKVREFNNELPTLRNYLDEMEKTRLEFLSRFPIASIPKMTIHEYAIGRGDHDNFCYWLERRLKYTGNFTGSTSYKFGVYYSKENGSYNFTQKFGGTWQAAYQEVRQDLVSLLKDGQANNLRGLIENKISPMFKGKILATYFPEDYLDVYSPDHLDFFLVQLRLDPDNLSKLDPIQKRSLLVDFKNRTKGMEDWTPTELAWFLYQKIGHPKKDQEQAESEEEDDSQVDVVFPARGKVTPEFIDMELPSFMPFTTKGGSKKKGKTDFESKHRRNKAIGDKGEEYVLRLEKNWLQSKGKSNLAEKVQHTAQDNDSAGYDILSVELDGSPKYIEVKSTTAKPGPLNFFLTANELEKARELENYYIYVVFEVASRRPKVWRWRHPFKDKREREGLEPVLYRFQSA